MKREWRVVSLDEEHCHSERSEESPTGRNFLARQHRQHDCHSERSEESTCHERFFAALRMTAGVAQ
jgi:hypothetical protein